jgi:2-oxoglutarate ferredoxin oxidoreductase subunit alpha
MCPVILLSDGHIANGAEPWRIPDLDTIPAIEFRHPNIKDYADREFRPYERDEETLARPWAIPGTPGLEHRLGGLEKDAIKGTVSYDPDNHDQMVRMRARKIERAADNIPPLQVRGPHEGDALLLGWGGTYGAILSAADNLREQGYAVSSAHLRYLNPMPLNTESVLRSFQRIIIPEINQGQLLQVIRGKYLVDAVGINETRGKMFRVETLVQKTIQILESDQSPVEQAIEIGSALS